MNTTLFFIIAAVLTAAAWVIFVIVTHSQNRHAPPKPTKRPGRVFIFEIPAHRYCSHCDLRRGGCKIPECIGKYRADGRDVIYKKVKI